MLLTNLELSGFDDQVKLGVDVLLSGLLLRLHQIVPIGNIDLPI